MWLKISAVALSLGLAGPWAAAQTYPFARLTGSPTLDSRGWNLVGDARAGDTSGDTDAHANEMVLCEPATFRSGACFYNQPVNISQCQRWAAEFDYRIFDGSGADGIAFCFLNNPPTGFTSGGNVGIPARPLGLMVILDTYLNCPGNTPVPKLLLRSADGNTTFGGATERLLECPVLPQPTSGTLPVLRQPAYNRMKITYNAGAINVYVNNTLMLSGFYTINFPGYFGFTASTGGSTDRHSVRDFTLYTFKPIVSPPDAGPARTICSGESAQLGVPPPPGDAYTYTWYPVTGLNHPTRPDPKVRLFNNSPEPVTYTYFVTKDSLANDTLCAYSAAVRVTVLGKAAQAGPDFSVCTGENRRINGLRQAGYLYAWTPATGLSDATAPDPFVRITNTGTTPATYRYLLTATPVTAGGCSSVDTLLVTVHPDPAQAGPDLAVCSGEPRLLGRPAQAGVTYRWSPGKGLSDSTAPQPVFDLPNATAASQTYRYVLTASNLALGCTRTDTLYVSVQPAVAVHGPASVCPNVTGAVYEIAGAPTGGGQWRVQGGVIRSGQGSSRITVDWGAATAAGRVEVTASYAPGCPAGLPVRVNPQLTPSTPVSLLHPDTLCLARATGIRYQTGGTPGSVYAWTVSANGVIRSGQGTPAVTVDWLQPGAGTVSVRERSVTRTDVCEGVSAPLPVWIEPPPDPASVLIRAVSVQPANERNITVRFRIRPSGKWKTDNGFTLSRRVWLPVPGPWAAVAALNQTDTLYTDNGLATDEVSYEYRLEARDQCDEAATAAGHASVVVAGIGIQPAPEQPEGKVQLAWNGYPGWPGGVTRYEVWQKLEEEGAYRLYETLPGSRLDWAKANATEGFRHCYRIRAVEAGGGGESWSNETCLDFEHPLFVPNVVTPNGDNANETWFIRNLELYRDHEITIVNRYGAVVMHTRAYGQDWDGRQVSPGVYYYRLTTGRGSQVLRGWVQVLP